jgi:hypothetical protein
MASRPDRPSWRQHLAVVAARQPYAHPYTLALQLEFDGYPNVTARQVMAELQRLSQPQAGAGETS